MREILFRGKRVDNGEWFYGVPTIDSRGQTVIVENVFDCDEYNCRGASCLYVDENTIGQYTGLTDKNGKKIFEGDILNTTNSNCATWYVDYKNTAFCCNQGNANYSCVLDEFMQFSVVEVIGNIHDNPELLKGGEKE